MVDGAALEKRCGREVAVGSNPTPSARMPIRPPKEGTLATRETPYPDINRLLDSLHFQMRQILPKKLVGLYLYGSLTMGDFDLESSDIDLLAALSSDVDETEFDDLREMHRDFAQVHKDWDDRVEVAYLSVTALKTFKAQSSKIAIISPGEPFHLKEAGKDWLMNWYLVRERGVALFGPSPKAIIEPITQEEFVQAVRKYATAWGEWLNHTQERKSQAYAILTMCRALYVHKNGKQVSKRQAALWAQKELPEWSGLIQRALVWREAGRQEQVDHASTYPETLQFVNFVGDQIVA